MLLLIIIFYGLYSAVKIYASFCEIGFIQKARNFKPIILSGENYIEAADYKIASQKFAIVSSVYDFFIFLFWVFFGFVLLDKLFVFENEILHSVLFLMGFVAVNYFLSLPLEIYQVFDLDKKFGFSTIDKKTFILDQLKSTVMFLIFGGAFFWAMSAIISGISLWWFYGFLFSMAVILFINMIYPTIIVPLFNKVTPLENESLKSAIESLLEKAGLKSSGVFSLDASKRDKRLNAYFGGLGSSKRVVLYDTLIEKLEKNELLAVLGHELGHFKHKDILKNIFSSALMLFIMFVLVGNIPQSLFEALGVNKGAYSIMGLFLLLSPLVSFVMMPLFGILSRHNEYRADEYGSECESKEALCSALVKLADENKSFPHSHPLTIALYSTHPPLVERLKKLGMNFEN